MIFDYCIRDSKKNWIGTCQGSSDAQARDRARVDYIYTVWGLHPQDREFRQRKDEADALPAKVTLSVGSLHYYQDLRRRIMEDGDQLRNAELRDYKEFQHYFKRT
jgi:hypothetical protein